MQIEIYKTNVQEVREADLLLRKLLEHFPKYKINFDLSDCDKILRVEADLVVNEKIISVVIHSGFECELILD